MSTKQKSKRKPKKPDFIPNAVLFKLDDGTPCFVKKENGMWDWDRAFKLDVDQWPDLSTAYPFEFVFVVFGDGKITTENSKTVIPDHSFLSLYITKKLQAMVEDDFNRRYS